MMQWCSFPPQLWAMLEVRFVAVVAFFNGLGKWLSFTFQSDADFALLACYYVAYAPASSYSMNLKICYLRKLKSDLSHFIKPAPPIKASVPQAFLIHLLSCISRIQDLSKLCRKTEYYLLYERYDTYFWCRVALSILLKRWGRPLH